MGFSFSLITFAYNEAELVEKQIMVWVEQFKKFTDDFEIILIDDGSTDATSEIVDRLEKEIPQLKVIHHPYNMGVGYAVRTARKYVTKDYVFWNDIDGHFSLADLEKVIPFLKDYDVIVAFKHDTTKTKAYFPWLKSRINYWLIKILFLSPIQDFQFVQFYPREFFCEGIELESYSSFIPAECMLKAQAIGLDVIQFQIHYYSHYSKIRPGKCSDFKTIKTSIRNIFSFWFKWYFLGNKKRAKEFYYKKYGASKPWRE
ncbi:MAG: glycosyltransferase family 2 protein [Candidatus Hydrogenedentota bacterium]